MKNSWVYAILGMILVVGLFLRSHNYTTWPREGATFDEFAWTFLGISMWEKGIPTSWSPHKAYIHRVEYYNPQGARFTLVTPYLEHPPLFGLVVGGFARLVGVRSFDEVTIARIRPLSLIMGVFSIGMVFLLASALYGSSVGLLSSAIYAVIPTVVIGSRLVQNENFFIPFFLLALYLAHRYIRHPSKTVLYLASIIVALLPLAKVPWIAAPAAVIGMFLVAKKWKESVFVGGVTILFFSVFLTYGFMLDSEVFLNLWKLQLARYDMAFDSLFVLFRDPVIADRALADGWIYFGWVTIILLLIKDIKKHMAITIGFLTYGAIFVFAIPSEGLHGWYRYPFYPFLAIATAVFIREHMNVNYFAVAVFYVVTGLSMFAGSWGPVFGFSYPVFRTYLIVVGVGALPAVFPKLSDKALFRVLNWAILVIIFALSCWTVLLYNEQ